MAFEAQIVGRADTSIEIGGTQPPVKLKARRKTKPESRSAAGNGNLLPGVDGRTIWGRHASAIYAELLADKAGVENTSASERYIMKCATVLMVELARLNSKFAAAGQASDSDLDLYQRTSNTMRRHLESVGLQRRAKDVSATPPSAEEYFAFKQRQKKQQATE